MKQRYLLLPVENQVREMDAKLLLAAVAAEEGARVIIGAQYFMFLQLHRLPKGLLIAKSMRSVNDATLKIASAVGHRIIAWDEEALVRFDAPDYYDWRYSSRIFELAEALLCWGGDDKAMFESFSGYRGTPINISGNPRIDLLRPEIRDTFRKDARRLRERLGQFILINTNFSFVNHVQSGLNLIQRNAAGEMVGLSREAEGMSLNFAEGMSNHQHKIMEHFKALLPLLCERYRNYCIVLRPHPSECLPMWQNIAAEEPNMVVEHEGNIIPWLMAADAVLHNGCTTAVESSILGRPVISYQPVTSDAHDYHLPNSLSLRADTPETVFAHLDTLLGSTWNRTGPDERQYRILAKHIESLTGNLAVERIMEILWKDGYLEPAPRPPLMTQVYGRLASQLRSVAQQLRMKIPEHRTNIKYQLRRFPELSQQTIEQRIADFGLQLDRFARIKVRPVDRFLFEITSDV